MGHIYLEVEILELCLILCLISGSHSGFSHYYHHGNSFSLSLQLNIQFLHSVSFFFFLDSFHDVVGAHLQTVS
jgi:hypothetical protein